MKTELITIARPYAAAIFAIAREDNNISAWGDMLEAAELITSDALVQNLLGNSTISSNKLAEFYCLSLENMLDIKMTRFLKLLAERKRLIVLSEIARLFQKSRALFEKTIKINVISAVPLEVTYKNKLMDVFSAQIKQKVILDCNVDSALLGGVQVRVGDQVFDGSVRGKLTRIFEFISGN